MTDTRLLLLRRGYVPVRNPDTKDLKNGGGGRGSRFKSSLPPRRALPSSKMFCVIVSLAAVAWGKNPALCWAQMADNLRYPKLDRHGGRRYPGQRDVKQAHGNSRAYILARLAREGHIDWIRAIESGRISAYAASVELGWTKRPPTQAGENANQARRRRWAIRGLSAQWRGR